MHGSNTLVLGYSTSSTRVIEGWAGYPVMLTTCQIFGEREPTSTLLRGFEWRKKKILL